MSNLQSMFCQIVPCSHSQIVTFCNFDWLSARCISSNCFPSTRVRISVVPSRVVNLLLSTNGQVSSTINCLGRTRLITIDVEGHVYSAIMKMGFDVDEISICFDLPRRTCVKLCLIRRRIYQCQYLYPFIH
jgi:hypothetical protein